MVIVKTLDIRVKNIEEIICCDEITFAIFPKFYTKYYLPHNFLELIESKGYMFHEIESVTFRR